MSTSEWANVQARLALFAGDRDWFLTGKAGRLIGDITRRLVAAHERGRLAGLEEAMTAYIEHGQDGLHGLLAAARREESK